MIDLLNRIGFRQIAFGGEGGGGGGGAKGRPAASNNVVSGAPRQAELMDQPHMLAYINPQEEQMLRDAGGAGIPGPDGIPVYGWWSDTWKEITSGGAANTETYNGGSNDDAYYDPYEDADLYDDDGYQPEYSNPDYGYDNNDNDTTVTVSPTDTSNVYDFYEPDPVTVSPTDTSNVYDFYEPDPVTVSPTDTSNVYDFYEPDPVVDYSPVDMDLGTGVYEPDPVDYSPVDMDLGTGVYEPDPVVDYSPVDMDLGTGVYEPDPVDYSPVDMDLGTGVYEPDPVDETSPFVLDADMLSKVTKGMGNSTTWVGNNTQEAINLNPNNRYDFDLADAYKTETTGALPVDGPVPRPRPDNLIMGRSPIGPTVTVSAKDALPRLGALPDGVTQQMITDSQNDGEYGYYNNDGSFVPANIDKYNGGGPDYSGVAFASGGGAQFDLDGDRFISKTEMGIGKAAGKELDQNFWSKAGTGLGVTSLGSGQEPTGVAKWAEKLIVPGGSTLRKLNPPAFERPLSSYDPNNPYADVGENAPNIWWEKGKTNPIGFEYKRTPDEVLADQTASREKATIAAANELTNNDNDNGPRTRREDLYGTRMTTEEYRRRYKGGGGAALPAYMRKYASGKSIDELVRKVKVNGKDYFLTPDGRYIEPSAFTGSAASRDIDVVETGESEQYLESYNVIDESTGIITTYNTDGSIMEVFDPNFESEEA
jgi:hypothetical protein